MPCIWKIRGNAKIIIYPISYLKFMLKLWGSKKFFPAAETTALEIFHGGNCLIFMAWKMHLFFGHYIISFWARYRPVSVCASHPSHSYYLLIHYSVQIWKVLLLLRPSLIKIKMLFNPNNKLQSFKANKKNFSESLV